VSGLVAPGCALGYRVARVAPRCSPAARARPLRASTQGSLCGPQRNRKRTLRAGRRPFRGAQPPLKHGGGARGCS